MFNLPATVQTAAGLTTFRYDSAHMRAVKDGPSGTTISLGGIYEKRIPSSGNTTHVFYVKGDGRTVAQIEWTESGGTIGSDVTNYLYDDSIGSVQATSGADGSLVTSSYEPFGNRLSGNDTSVRIGFAGQVEDDDIGLVDMGGRVYDPAIARFVTPDPFVQSPFYGQSYNRYAYAWNNPLRIVDPTGFDGEGDLEGLEDGDVEAMFSEDNFWTTAGFGDMWGPGNFETDMSALLATFNATNGFGGNAVGADQFDAGTAQSQLRWHMLGRQLQFEPFIFDANETAAEPPWNIIGKQQFPLAVQESGPGETPNPIISQYFRIGVGQNRDDKTPWCAATVNYTLVMSGVPGSGSAYARSFNPADPYVGSPNFVEIPSPGAVGAIAVREERHATLEQGFDPNDPTRIIGLGGNQNGPNPGEGRLQYSSYSISELRFYYPVGYTPSPDPLPVFDGNYRQMNAKIFGH
jgi:RHS repeat-associated protein